MIKKFFQNKWVTVSLVAISYLLWVIWLGNFWWLLGLGIIFDLYITKKVPWAFWKIIKPKNKFQKWLIGWVDAIIFAVVAASFIRLFFFEAYTIPTSSMEGSLLIGDFLFVSKCNYGPRTQMTPIAFPFVHHSMPFSNNMTKSFSSSWQMPYKRLGGFEQIENDDIVVFNFPEGDTVILTRQAQSFYQIKRDFPNSLYPIGPKDFQRYTQLQAQFPDKDECFYEYFKDSIVYRPVDKRENYIKRCVAIPGDTLVVKNGYVFINNTKQAEIAGLQFKYDIIVDGTILKRINEYDIREIAKTMYGYKACLNSEQVSNIKANKKVTDVVKNEMVEGQWYQPCFPQAEQFAWNKDFMGPIIVPKAGATVKLTLQNLPLYQRIIDVYEYNTLEVVEGKIIINGAEANSYTFKMDYYWMMGDNRDNSQDSRFWGFVPQDHIVGKAVMVWLSLDNTRPFPLNIRWSRLFSFVHKN